MTLLRVQPNTTRQIGESMEQEAINYLESNGFYVMARNYRFKRTEIDIIAKKDDFIVFIEVKYRKNNKFGHPENFVSDSQIERIRIATEEFILQRNYCRKIRFDIISVTLQNSKVQIDHFEDAF